MKNMQKAFEALAIDRITVLECKKREHFNCLANEERYKELYRNIEDILVKHEAKDLLKEFDELVHLQMYEMYTAIYLLGLSDALQLPKLISNLELEV